MSTEKSLLENKTTPSCLGAVSGSVFITNFKNINKMDKLGHLYETPTLIQIADKLPILCKKGIKLKVVKDSFDASYLHELTNYWREGLKEKKLKEGDVIDVIGCWMNLYGSYIKCNFNNETFDIEPKNLSFSWDLN